MNKVLFMPFIPLPEKDLFDCSVKMYSDRFEIVLNKRLLLRCTEHAMRAHANRRRYNVEPIQRRP